MPFNFSKFSKKDLIIILFVVLVVIAYVTFGDSYWKVGLD